MNNLDKILASDSVVKAYITPDNKFLKVENKNGAVFTIWEKMDGYQMSSPIQPNHRTGSSTYVMGEGDWDYGTLENVLEVIEKNKSICPRFFNIEDIKVTKFLNIENAVNIHGNILEFKKIEL